MRERLLRQREFIKAIAGFGGDLAARRRRTAAKGSRLKGGVRRCAVLRPDWRAFPDLEPVGCLRRQVEHALTQAAERDVGVCATSG